MHGVHNGRLASLVHSRVESLPIVVPLRLGYKVALVDADIGLRNLDLLLGLENRVLYTAIDILDGECR